VINRFTAAVAATTLALGTAFGVIHQSGAARAQAAPRVFEIRTYTTHPGKLEALNTRFRNHTLKLFEKHGMTNVGYWTPSDAPLAENTLIYVVAHKSRDAAKASWDAFRSDPDWVKARTASEAAGPIVVKIDSVFLNATDYSPLK
jgi:hypothetical protein